jgi:hypothetical protein
VEKKKPATRTTPHGPVRAVDGSSIDANCRTSCSSALADTPDRPRPRRAAQADGAALPSRPGETCLPRPRTTSDWREHRQVRNHREGNGKWVKAKIYGEKTAEMEQRFCTGNNLKLQFFEKTGRVRLAQKTAKRRFEATVARKRIVVSLCPDCRFRTQGYLKSMQDGSQL